MRDPARHRLQRVGACTIVCLSACAAPVQVTEVASGNGQPVFDMQGDSLTGLQATADRACPHGHLVLRRWQGGQTSGADANIADRAWFQTQRLIGENSARAQLVVQCLPAAPEVPTTEPAWTAPVDAGAPKGS